MSLLSPWLESPWSERIGWTLVHSVWQVALATALFAVLALALRRSSANTRYLLGCFALVAMVAWPLATYVAFRSSPRSVDTLSKRSTTSSSERQTASADDSPEFDPHLVAASAPQSAHHKVGVSIADARSIVVAAVRNRLDHWTAALPWLAAVWLVGVSILALRPLGGLIHVGLEAGELGFEPSFPLLQT